MVLFISLFTIFTNLYLGLSVFIRNRKSATHRLFVLFTFLVALWSATNYFSLSADTPAEALFKIRVVLSVAVLMFSILYFFSANFPAPNLRLRPLHLGLIIVPSLLIIILVFTNLVFRGVSIKDGVITPIPNFGLFFYSSVVIGLPLASSIILIRKFFLAEGKEKEQLKFLSLGIIATFILTTVTNFLLVNIFKFTNLVVLGPFFTLIFVAFSTYAILRHQLMNIRVILTEAFVFLIAFILLIDIFISNGIYQKFLKTGIFLIFFFFAYLLVKSVLNEIKQREDLRKTNIEIEKLSRAKTEFLSIASHQLRTPLTAIKGYVSLALEGIYGKLNNKTSEILDRVYKSNERLIELINDLLNISRIESGKIDLKPENLQIENIISDIIKELEIEAEKKDIYLSWNGGQKPLPQIRADKEKIREVIFNIIDNAIKYTVQGGVTVKLEIEHPLRGYPKLKIVISDTGAGMTLEEISGIFKSFARGETGAKIWTGGTGLGLYVAKKFVEMQGGKIWAESEGEGKGSTFYIELPCV